LKRLSPSEIPLNELEIGSEVGSGTYGRFVLENGRRTNIELH
jgi:hypothetical protein